MDRRAEAAGTSFTVVQALRGLAALWVVLFHASEGGHVDALKAVLPRAVAAGVFDAGHYGVAVFFALSGFVIAHSLRDVAPSWAFLGRFALRRSIRLDPPYWASMLVVVALAAVSARAKGAPFVPPDAGTVGAHLLYLQVLLGRPAINVVYWTLTYEVQFYLFLAAMLVGARRLSLRSGGRWAAIAWTAMTMLAVAGALGAFRAAPAGLFVSLWAPFFVGVLGYHAPSRGMARLALAGLAAAMLMGPAGDGFLRISAATAILLSIALATGWIAQGLDWAPLQFLGTISYSLYLLHNPLTGATAFLSRRLFGEGLGGAASTLALLLAVSIAGATLFWWAVERAAHRLSRRVRL